MITVVSLAWNKLDMTRDFLERLEKYTDIPFQLIFTDNASEEPIPALVKEIFPEADLIVKDKNVGCPGTRNEAMEHVKTDICFWLDNDTMVGPNWYKPIMRELEREDIGVSGPQGCVVNKPWGQPPFREIANGYCDYFVGWLMGFKTKAYKPINDYQIPVNLDDVECCFGIKDSGYKAIISGPCFAKHLTSQTDRGWQESDKVQEMWQNWKDKTYLFEEWKCTKSI